MRSPESLWKLLLAGLLLTPVALQSGCASIVQGTTQMVQVRSIPAGADIHINGAYQGTTPKLVQLQRGTSYHLLLEYPGYQPWDLELERRFNPWILGNVVTGVLPGTAVDALDGAAFRVYPPGVTATLIPTREPPPRNAPEQPAQATPNPPSPVALPHP